MAAMLVRRHLNSSYCVDLFVSFLAVNHRSLPFSATTFLSNRTDAPAASNFAVDYLVSSCGLSTQQADKASSRLAHLKSASRPNSVLGFFKDVGLTNAEIAVVVSSSPRLLCAHVDKTLKPKIAQLKLAGFSPSDIHRLISISPTIIYHRDLITRIRFFLPMFATIEKLLKILKRNHFLFTSDFNKIIAPNMELLQRCGLSVCDIGKLLVSMPRLISMKPDKVEEVVRRADELGIPRFSRMFRYALAAGCSSETKMKSRLEFLKSLGWSDDDITISLSMKPTLLQYSDENIRSKVEFLTRHAGLDVSELVHCPTILTLSLERRLIPRHRVLQILKLNGVKMREWKFSQILCLSHEKFQEMFVLPHEDRVPGLCDAFNSACAGISTAMFEESSQDA